MNFDVHKRAQVPDVAPHSMEERRAYERVRLTLPGRYMLEDGTEYPCETVNISPLGVLLRGLKPGQVGSRVVAYIEGVGRLEGVVVRSAAGVFALALLATPRKAGRLAERITWLSRAGGDLAQDAREHPRMDGGLDPVSVRTPNGMEHRGALIDLSIEGAALLLEARVVLGDTLVINGLSARVVRTFRGGCAVKFDI